MKKRFTLMLIAALVAVTSFAQPQLRSFQKMLPLETKSVSAQAITRRAPRKVDVVPETATFETYTLMGMYRTSDGTSSVESAVSVAFDGTDVYVQGLSVVFPEAWVQGTLGDGEVVFPVQYLGDADWTNSAGETITDHVYIGGYDSKVEEFALLPLTFSFDSETGNMEQTDGYFVLENAGTEAMDLWGYWQAGIILTYGEPEPDIIIEAPEDLETFSYKVVADEVSFDDDDNVVTEPVKWGAKVGFDGADVYVQGFYEDSEMWIKGTYDGEKFFFPTKQVIGDYYGYTLYFMPFNTDGEILDGVNATIDFDTYTITFDPEVWLVINASKTSLYYLGIYANVVLEMGSATEATYEWVAAEQGYENTEEVVEVEFADGITGVFDLGTNTNNNTPKYYTRGEAVRMYKGNTLTITSTTYPLIGINVESSTTYASFEADNGIMSVGADGFSWTPEEGAEVYSVTFSVPEETAQSRIVSMEIIYDKALYPVELPEDAEVSEYRFRATIVSEETDPDSGEVQTVTEEVERPVFVSFYDDKVYIQGLSKAMDDGWVCGTMTDGVLTIPEGQYMGVYEWYYSGSYYDLDVFFSGATFTYDSEKDEFTTSAYTTEAFYEDMSMGNLDDYVDVVITKINDVAATPADPYFTGWNLDVNETNYPLVRYEIPTVDTEGNTILTSKLAYIFWVETEEGQSQYTCVAGVYEYLDEDLTEIPSTFADNWDIYPNKLYVYTDAEDFTAWKKIGIQSVYYGGGERHESNIVWEDLTEYWEAVGIEDITAADAKSVKFYDLQGRQVTADAKGVVIRVAQMANGSTKTTKMLRK